MLGSRRHRGKRKRNIYKIYIAVEFDMWNLVKENRDYQHWSAIFHPVYNWNYVSKYGICTTLQTGRSRVRFPMVSLEFFSDI